MFDIVFCVQQTGGILSVGYVIRERDIGVAFPDRHVGHFFVFVDIKLAIL